MSETAWQDISTAPKDGTTILLWAAAWDMSWGMTIGHFEGDGEGDGIWVTAEGEAEENEPGFDPDEEIDPDEYVDTSDEGDWERNTGPTHWQPLPPLPTNKGGEIGGND